ncbi:hypothetical protein SEA_STROSAHL_55 [Gordonia phage Strosahl]|uniref:Uncharacterized protein n=2 Tax=Soupsvirus strosahl TaxID=2560510 RepID=A0A1B3B1B0_9CAUD|nr:membrane protein [Gordonia phage Rosalind]YP_009281666.1 membrane protein [Gordonia phage Remus]YP_009596256.1 membrane protein [Gordonia phage Strosahl]ANA87136.1 hypothetical protein PBI_ROSALIND_54 [Gordonia phage Rosalind]AOE44665.1 hypothetical protein SEA_REMUS_55 [Gordonia phage Remus]AOE44766.1 hypothetical protein SEA_STROSAHL_55 [Gordonia phage Strosahl]
MPDQVVLSPIDGLLLIAVGLVSLFILELISPTDRKYK